ncbi:MAG TPA: DUF4235 domain-containing protein [Propionibacteriaceae bacterium]|nr:DUF4235 domain-containing protein [Propionibacteriaceae bacterium]
MAVTNKLVWKVYSGVLGAVTALVAHRVVTVAWKIATGDEPPARNDPNVPARQAAIWALASGLGIGAGQLAVRQFTSERYARVIADQEGDHA